jgi:hypothetical protein
LPSQFQWPVFRERERLPQIVRFGITQGLQEKFYFQRRTGFGLGGDIFRAELFLRQAAVTIEQPMLCGSQTENAS